MNRTTILTKNNSSQTPNILSSTEWRRFWIRIYVKKTNLIIEVGNDFDTNSDPFMKRTWIFESVPHKFMVPKYLAFSTGHDRSVTFCQPRNLIYRTSYHIH